MMRRPTWYTNTFANILATVLWILVILGLLFVWPGPQLADGNNPFTGKPSPLLADISNALNPVPAATDLPVAATEPPVAATEPPVTESPTAPLPTDTPVPPTPEPEVVVKYEAPAHYFPLLTEEKALKGVAYSLNEKGPKIEKYPYGATFIWASGKFDLAGTLSTIFVGENQFKFGETIGDIMYDVCKNPNGCAAGEIGMVAGHAAVTVVFPEYEEPNATLAWAINHMFDVKSGNCGSGCKEVYVGDLSTGKVYHYTAPVEATALDYAVDLNKPIKVEVVLPGIPTGSSVLLAADGETPEGHTYFLKDKEAYVTINEAGGTIAYLGDACTVDGVSYPAGTALARAGNPTDGSTPKDLNGTLEFKCGNPGMVRVWVVYAGSFEARLAAIQNENPTWTWK